MSQTYSFNYVIDRTSKSHTSPFPVVLISTGLNRSDAQHSVCISAERLMNDVLLKWLVVHQSLFQMCENEMQLIKVHSRNISVISIAR